MPVANWTTNTTGALDGSGAFSNSIPVDPASRRDSSCCAYRDFGLGGQGSGTNVSGPGRGTVEVPKPENSFRAKHQSGGLSRCGQWMTLNLNMKQLQSRGANKRGCRTQNRAFTLIELLCDCDHRHSGGVAPAGPGESQAKGAGSVALII